MMILMSTLRRYNHLEKILLKYLKRPIDKHSKRIHLILLLTICQIIYLEIAPHAAVNIAIELTKKDKKSNKLKNLVNAVLRKVSREIDEILTDKKDPIDLLPIWLLQKWEKVYSILEIRTIANTLMEIPPLDLSLTYTHGNQKIAEELGGLQLASGSIRLKNYSHIPDLKYYNDGYWWVQDVSAAIPVKIIENEIKNKNFVDLCAAPGGKTASLISCGAKVVAIEKNSQRIEILRENLKRLNFGAEIVLADATKWVPNKKFDGVLLDPPCSSTGVLRKNPDILLRKDIDLSSLIILQKKLLSSGIDMLNKGGILIYCTCSLEPEEGEEQINNILKLKDDIKIRKITSSKVPGFEKAITKEGYMRIIPGMIANGGNDGFFISILEKK